MTLWFVLALMTAAAIFSVLWPLSRQNRNRRSGSDLAVYRDQLEEIERDRASGLIAATDADAARVEVSRRLLAAADRAGEEEFPAASSSRAWRRSVAMLSLVALPLAAALLYLSLGAPGQPGASARGGAETATRSIESMVAQVEAHLEKNPDDGRGWEVIAPIYMRLGRFDDAARARRHALRLFGASAAREANLGEALVAAANDVVTAEAKATFERALALDAQDFKARFFIGLAARQDGDIPGAARIWRALLDSMPADAPYRPLVAQSLAGIEPKAAEPGPSQEDIAAAQNLSSEQRSEMVRGMVEGLAARLKSDGGDIDGWVRLMRAYLVLGERDKAIAAAEDARRALAGDAEKQQRLNEAVKDLGLQG